MLKKMLIYICQVLLLRNKINIRTASLNPLNSYFICFLDDISRLRSELLKYRVGGNDSYYNLTSMSYYPLLIKEYGAYGEDYHYGYLDGLVDGWNDLQRNVSQCLIEYEVYLTRVQDWLLHPLSYTSRYVGKSAWKRISLY